MKNAVARIPLLALATSFLIHISAGVVLACSGSRASELTQHNRSIVNVYGFVAVVLFLATVALYFARHRTGILAIPLSLIVGFFHPFWHYGGGGGDCGFGFVELAKYVTMILAGILILQAALWRVRRHRNVAKHT